MKAWVDTCPGIFPAKMGFGRWSSHCLVRYRPVFPRCAHLDLPNAQDTPTTAFLGDMAAGIRAARAENPIFVYAVNPFRQGIESFIDVIRVTISEPASGAIIPMIGWFGVVALIGFIVFATSNWRTSLLSMALVLGCGILGMWTYSMDTLALTLGAVILSLAIALPIGVWAGLNDKVMKAVRPILDLAQITPTLVYLPHSHWSSLSVLPQPRSPP